MERGLYEQIADEGLEAALEALVGRYQAQRLDEGDSHVVLAEHMAHLLTQVLRRQPAQHRLNHQVELCNRVVRVLSESDAAIQPGARALPSDARRLLSVHGDEPVPPRPDTPLSETSLLTGTRTDPSLDTSSGDSNHHAGTMGAVDVCKPGCADGWNARPAVRAAALLERSS